MQNSLILNIALIATVSWRRRYLILVPILMMPVVGLVVGIASPKRYEAHTTVLIQEAARHNPFLQDLTVATNLKKRMTAINALLHSNHMLAEVADKTGLISDETPDYERQAQIELLSNSLRAKLLGEDLIRISYTSNTAEGMEELLSLVSLRFVERIIAPQRATIYRSEEFLKKELESRRQDLKSAEQKLAAYKSEFADQLPDQHGGNVSRLAQLRQSLTEQQRILSAAEAARDGLRQKLSQTNPVLGRIEEAIVQRLSELAVLRSSYTDRHTRVQGALHQLESLREQRAELLKATQQIDISDIDRLWNLASSQSIGPQGERHPLLISQLQALQDTENQIQSQQQQVNILAAEVTLLKTRVAGFGQHEQHLNELERELSSNRKIYAELSERYQKARVTGALGRWEANELVKLIDPPFTPLTPSNPPAMLFVVAGLAGGIALGIGLALMCELMDTRIRHRRHLEALTCLPVIARIPPIGGTRPHSIDIRQTGL